MSSKPKRQKTLPAALQDLADTPTTGAAAAAAGSAKKRAPKAKSTARTKALQQVDESPNSLYGLYSTEAPDWLAGCWFPIKYVGPTPAAPQATATPTPTAAAADATPAAAADAPATAAAAAEPESILIRWTSHSHKRYSAEPLHLAFVRSAGEFTRLPVASMRPGKRVLVRDILEDHDFCGSSYWLATITAEPEMPKATKKRASSGFSGGQVKVEYQNTKWQSAIVPIESIYVLHKTRAKLELVAQPESPHASEAEDDDEGETSDEDHLVQLDHDDIDTPLAAASASVDLHQQPFAHSTPQFASIDAVDEAMLPPPQSPTASGGHDEPKANQDMLSMSQPSNATEEEAWHK